MPDASAPYCPKIHYRKTGSGPALVLIHGFPADGSLWDGVSDVLSNNFTLLVPDMPGSGGSAPINENCGLGGMDAMAGCIKAMLDQEGIKKAVIAGHSMGGYVALAFAASYPQYVLGVSLVHSTPIADDEEKKDLRRRAIGLIQNGGRKAFVTQMVQNLFSAAFKQNSFALVEKQIENCLGLGEKSLVFFYNAMINRKDYSQWLKNVSIPVQWIIGLEDNVLDYKKLLQFCCLASTNFVTFYTGCGHMSMIECPGKLEGDLVTFSRYCNNVNL